MTPGYEVRDAGTRWEAVRHDEAGESVFCTWDREAVPDHGGRMDTLTQVGWAVRDRWGRDPQWERTSTGWVAR
jgi:hypothetical protein